MAHYLTMISKYSQAESGSRAYKVAFQHLFEAAGLDYSPIVKLWTSKSLANPFLTPRVNNAARVFNGQRPTRGFILTHHGIGVLYHVLHGCKLICL